MWVYMHIYIYIYIYVYLINRDMYIHSIYTCVYSASTSAVQTPARRHSSVTSSAPMASGIPRKLFELIIQFRRPKSKKRKHNYSSTVHFSNDLELIRRKVTTVSLISLMASRRSQLRSTGAAENLYVSIYIYI